MKTIIKIKIYCHDIIDYFAVSIGCWALRRLYGANCEMDVHEEFDDQTMKCVSCDAKRLIDDMKEIYK